MFLAIINDTYSEVKEELSSQKDDLQITDIIKQVKASLSPCMNAEYSACMNAEYSATGLINLPTIPQVKMSSLCDAELHENIHEVEAKEGENIRCSQSTAISIRGD